MMLGKVRRPLEKVSHHRLSYWMLVQNFHNYHVGLTRAVINFASSDTLISKTQNALYDLFEEITMKNYQ